MMITKAILCFFVLFFSSSHGQSIIRQPIPLKQPFNINKTHGGSIIRVPLPLSSFNINKTQSSSDCSYMVTITTSCSSPKYTRDQISLSFGDSYGYQVYAARLDDPSSGAFERCSVETYEMTGRCLYEVCYLYLYRSGYDGWIPDTVEVYGYYTGCFTFYYQTSIPNDVWYGFNYCNGASSSTSVGAMRLFGYLFQLQWRWNWIEKHGTSDLFEEAGLELLRSFGNVECLYDLSLEDLCAKISQFDALIVRSGTKVTRQVFEAANGRLKVMGRAGVGIDNVDLQAATELGCLVVNAPTANLGHLAQVV